MQNDGTASFRDRAPDGRPAGIAIAICAMVAIVAISHHPTVSTRAPAEALTQMVQLAPMDRIVHGTLIAIMGVLLFSFAVYSLRRGLHRATSVGAFIAYATGIAAVIGAALIDGFLTPAIAERYAGASADAVKSAIPLLVYGALTIQVLSKFGFVAMSIGVAFWSADLISAPGVLRMTGIVGFVSGIVAVGLLAFAGHLNPHSLGAIVIVQAVWYLAVAVLLVRRLV
ncbi:MAG: hypothetical protein QOF71_1974 [Candidatus Eremiobacteraeota bacterium]|nr:hypothetical protein [Candidatus Eremiobacteraeota bacterium]